MIEKGLEEEKAIDWGSSKKTLRKAMKKKKMEKNENAYQF